MTARKRPRLRHILSAIAYAAAFATSAYAQVRPSSAALLFDLLEGAWVGEGTLMGRAAAYTMTWTGQSDGTVRLEFTNGFRGADGVVTPVLSAVATYATEGERVVAVWTDDRPQRLTIVGTATDSLLTSDWTASAEEGRTEYRVRPDGSVQVRDWVRSRGELRPFGEAVYRRSGG